MPKRPLSAAAFLRLLYNKQLRALHHEGDSLAQRPEPEGAVYLYHFRGGYFVEAFFTDRAGMITRFRTFTDTAELEPYLALVVLPEDL
jgi:hypothetical protein